MILTEGMLLFHGSYMPIEKIDLNMCADGKDFGKGFYLTSDIQQARNFVKSSVVKAKRHGYVPQEQECGYITSFRFHQGNVKVHTFQKADKEWLWFIAHNRRSRHTPLPESFLAEIANSDIIVGKVANDQTNPVITTYLNGLYGDIESDETIEYTIKRLMPEHLVDQYCFLTEQGIKCLEFQEARKYVR